MDHLPIHHWSTSLSLSLYLTHTEFVWINIFLISIYIKQGLWQASHLEAGDGYRTWSYIWFRCSIWKNINATQISNIVSGSTNLLPVVADSFFGTLFVAAVSACISLLVILFTVLQLARCTVYCVCSLLARFSVVRLSWVIFNLSI